jgi:GNAT superfamily N-acetyltransferase
LLDSGEGNPSVISVKVADRHDAVHVAQLVYELLIELTAPETWGVSLDQTLAITRTLLDDKLIAALLATSSDGEVAGVLTLNECAAVYAGGRFGEICELYVRQNHRGSGAGRLLIAAAKELAAARKWTRLEVGTPPEDVWSRTVAFYHREGFIHSGARLRLPIKATT